MPGNEEMRRIQEEEMRKMRLMRQWHFHGFAYPQEIDEVREKLRLSGVRFRTEKVFEQGRLKGYKIFTA
tara:strand:- start:900 stop:1106 length:207 start_codon:yes stop_codon:yes gene_type:complete